MSSVVGIRGLSVLWCLYVFITLLAYYFLFPGSASTRSSLRTSSFSMIMRGLSPATICCFLCLFPLMWWPPIRVDVTANLLGDQRNVDNSHSTKQDRNQNVKNSRLILSARTIKFRGWGCRSGSLFKWMLKNSRSRQDIPTTVSRWNAQRRRRWRKPIRL